MSDDEKRALNETRAHEHHGVREEDFTHNELWVRYVGLDGHILAGPFLVDEDDYDSDHVDLLSPPEPPQTKGIIEFSLNK